MKIWILRLDAAREDQAGVAFNALVKAPNREGAITIGLAEMQMRGWEAEVLRTGEFRIDDDLTSKPYLQKAIGDTQAYGFGFICYGEQDN